MVDHHKVILRRLGWSGGTDGPAMRGTGQGSGPVILERIDQEFIPSILDELTSRAGRDRLAAGQASTLARNGVLKLFQPVHRTFHVVLLELVCAPYDQIALQPRLDPQRIESAGLVLRRIAQPPAELGILNVNAQRRSARNGSDAAMVAGRAMQSVPSRATTLEGWRSAGKTLRGWASFSPHEDDLDPDPRRRRMALSAGHPEINLRIAALGGASAEPLTESVSPLFVAPPEVCVATGKTILYGLIPVSSAEFSEAPATEPLTIDFVAGHLNPLLRARATTRPLGAAANRTLTPNLATSTNGDIQNFIALLRQLMLELDAFGDSPQSQALLSALNTISLPYEDDIPRPAGQVLRKAASILIGGEALADVFTPQLWPAISPEQSAAIANAAKAALDERQRQSTPRQGRFDDATRQYRIRAFARITQPDDCPPTSIWSDYSPPFMIAPWYENSAVPPVRVTLPDLFKPNSLKMDPAKLKQLKPHVAFEVPDGLFKLLQGAGLQAMLDGKQPSSGGPVLNWICAFNIPTITICAFIVLNIFLQLFNLIFQWLLFIKICIPLPNVRLPGQDEG